MSFFDDDDIGPGLDEDFVSDDDLDNYDENQDEDETRFKTSFEKDENEDEDEEYEPEGEMTIEEKKVYSSLPKDIEIITNGKYSYIVVDRKTLDSYPDILSTPIPILLKWVDSSLTFPFLSRYEASALIERRVEELTEGEKSTIGVGDEIDSFAIAERELKEGKLPLLVERTRKNGGKRIFYIDPNGENSLGFKLFKGDYM